MLSLPVLLYTQISIHAPRTGSDVRNLALRSGFEIISIHAPRTGSDLADADVEEEALTFQSTLPARGATGRDPLIQAELAISIHAPRTGSDRVSPSSLRRA